jgi:hypothetical protein
VHNGACRGRYARARGTDGASASGSAGPAARSQDADILSGRPVELICGDVGKAEAPSRRYCNCEKECIGVALFQNQKSGINWAKSQAGGQCTR